MAYSDFTLSKALKTFRLENKLFDFTSEIEASEIRPNLKTRLSHSTELALMNNTEKARSEFIIAPLLAEMFIQTEQIFSFFSGVEFSVDIDMGLYGDFDFIISQSPVQDFIEAPVIFVIEACNTDVMGELGSCIAAMVGAREFNFTKQKEVPAIFGAVTSGDIWRFLKLEGWSLYIDKKTYYINQSDKILGILLHIMKTNSKVTV
jgi:hypothetical protein